MIITIFTLLAGVSTGRAVWLVHIILFNPINCRSPCTTVLIVYLLVVHLLQLQALPSLLHHSVSKAPQLISETNIPLLIPGWWRLRTEIRTAYACRCGNALCIYNRAKESMKSTALAVGIKSRVIILGIKQVSATNDCTREALPLLPLLPPPIPSHWQDSYIY